MNDNTCLILVLGMHRSGTSAITRGLQAIGVELGDNFAPGAQDNKKGFWEDRDFNALNIELLDHFCSRWDSLRPIPPADFQHPNLAPYRLRAIELIRDKLRHGRVIGLKDPRATRLLPFWQGVFDHLDCRVGYVIALRHPLSVSKSLVTRNRLDPIKSHYLWLTHLVPAITETDGRRRLVVSYERMLEHPQRELSRIAEAMHFPPGQDEVALATYSEEFLEPALSSSMHPYKDIHLDPSIPAEVITAYQELTRLAESTDFTVPPPCQEIFTQLAERSRLLGPAFSLMDQYQTEQDRLGDALIELKTAEARLADQLRVESMALQEQLRQSQQAGNDLREHLASREHVYQQAQATLAELDTELRTTRQLVDERDQALHQAQADQITQERRCAELDQDLHAARQECIQLSGVIDARNEGIAWLRDEVERSKADMLARRMSPKFLLLDSLFMTVRRLPGLRPAAAALLPKGLQRRLLANAPETHFAFLDAVQVDTARRDSAPPPASSTTAAITVARQAGWPVVKCSNKYDIVCFANIEWAARYQRPQHMMAQFAENGHRVYYVIASRQPPRNTPYTISRVRDNVYEVALAVHAAQDFYTYDMSGDNLSAMHAALLRLARDQRIKTAVSVLHLPYWYKLAAKLRGEFGWHMHYDCMDEWEDFPAIGRDMLRNEAEMVGKADLVTVTSAVLFDKWSRVNPRCLLVRNGVDFDFFTRYGTANPLLEQIGKPVVGYYGALAEWVDFELIADVAKQNPDLDFVLLGDVFVKDMAGIDKLANVHLLGRQPYETMPKYLFNFDVCIIPFKLNKITHAVDPVKFYEFISLGKPVVCVPMDEMKTYAEQVYFAEGAERFSAGIRQALHETDPDLARRRIELARENTWRNRYSATRDGLLASYPLASVIVVSYNNLDLTRQCLDSLFDCTAYPRYEVIVIDNNSTDGTPDYLRDLSHRRPEMHVILNDHNAGFAKANNQALRIAGGDVLILLNNDTVVTAGWIDGLLHHLEDERIGLIGPVTNSVGNEARISVSYNDIDQMPAFADDHVAARHGVIFDIKMLAMFCIAMRRDVFEKVGYLDEEFGIGMFEDDDYSMRVKQLGYRVVCAEDVFIHHYGQASFAKLIHNGEYDALWRKNQAYFESKWGAWEQHSPR